MPKFLCCSDLHLSDNTPRCRKDDWYEAQFKIFDQLEFIAKDNQIDAVLFAGDFFDKPKVCPKLERFAIENIKRFKIPWYVIAGQHDLHGHNNGEFWNCSIGVLSSACSNFTPLSDFGMVDNSVCIYGNLFGEDFLPIKDRMFHNNDHIINRLDYTNIVLLHELLWHKEIPFVNAPDSGNINKYLHGGLSPFQILISGDNHKGFVVQTYTELIINCGTMMRRNIGEINYAPFVTILDIDNNTVKYKQVFLDTSKDIIEVPDNVKTEKMTSDELNEFIGLLKNQDGTKELSFENALKKVISEKKTRNEVINLIYQYKGNI